jgi:translation elongation factor EF-Tu-like GTPase
MFRMTVSDVFFIRGRGLVATGKAEDGPLRVGEDVSVNGGASFRVDGIEAFRKKLDEAQAGQNIGVLLESATKEDVKSGDVLTSGAWAPTPTPPPAESQDVETQHDNAMRALGRDPE